VSRDRLDDAPAPAITLRDDVVTWANRDAGAPGEIAARRASAPASSR
jgi:hypothetical protein